MVHRTRHGPDPIFEPDVGHPGHPSRPRTVVRPSESPGPATTYRDHRGEHRPAAVARCGRVPRDRPGRLRVGVPRPPAGRRAASGSTPNVDAGVASDVRRRLDDTGLIALDMEPVFVTPGGDYGEAMIEAAATIGARNLLVVFARRRRRTVRRPLRRTVRSRGDARHRLQSRVHALHVGTHPAAVAGGAGTRRPCERCGPDRSPPPRSHRRYGRRRRRDRRPHVAVRPTLRCPPPCTGGSVHRGDRRATPARRRRTPGRRTRRHPSRPHGAVDGDPLGRACGQRGPTRSTAPATSSTRRCAPWPDRAEFGQLSASVPGTDATSQYGIVPPSTGNMQPVMFLAASEASSTATAATSSTVFGRLIADSELNIEISAS